MRQTQDHDVDTSDIPEVGEDWLKRASLTDPAEGRNSAKIHALMREHGLSYRQAAKLLRSSLHTIQAWLKPCRYDAPDWAVELLCLKLGAPVPAWLQENAEDPVAV